MKRRKLISVIVLILLLLNLSIGVFAEGDPGPIRPKIKIVIGGEEPEYPIISPCAEDDGTTRPK